MTIHGSRWISARKIPLLGNPYLQMVGWERRGARQEGRAGVSTTLLCPPFYNDLTYDPLFVQRHDRHVVLASCIRRMTCWLVCFYGTFLVLWTWGAGSRGRIVAQARCYPRGCGSFRHSCSFIIPSSYANDLFLLFVRFDCYSMSSLLELRSGFKQHLTRL